MVRATKKVARKLLAPSATDTLATSHAISEPAITTTKNRLALRSDGLCEKVQSVLRLYDSKDARENAIMLEAETPREKTFMQATTTTKWKLVVNVPLITKRNQRGITFSDTTSAFLV